jgi:hypothetical protein
MSVSPASETPPGVAPADQASEDTTRWVRVGHSWLPGGRAAGIAAARDALGRSRPELLLVFASFGYNLPELLDGVHSVSGTVPVIGCSTAGEIGPGPALASGVVIVALGGDFAVTTARATGLHDGPRSVGEAVARGLLPLPDTRYRIALLLTDALAGDQQEMIRGVYGVLGAAVPLIGGGAGDDFGMVTSRQFHRSDVLQDSVVAALIGSDALIGLSIRHGWHREGRAMVVTGSAGNRVDTLDDQPALDVYLRRHRAPEGMDADREAFADFALTRPLAITRRGDVAVRHVLGADPVSRSLMCAGGVPKGAAAWLATGDVASTLAAADTACADAVEQLGGVPPLALLVFDCAGRRAVLGDEGVLAERRHLVAHAGAAPLAGFYTYGEIARAHGVNGFHNQTIVAVALS